MSLRFKIEKKYDRDSLLTNFGKAILRDRYLMSDEDYQDLFARVASAFADDQDHANRIYKYMSKMWFMPATPILSNGGTPRGMPISCFLNECDDSLRGISDLWMENVWLASRGGGIGSYWGNVRSINEKVGINGKTSGIIPFIKVQDSMTLAISQGSLRRGSTAVYLDVSHPEIEEFIDIRRPTGGDVNRKSLNIHHGVVISDAFMRAVENDDEWNLISPSTGEVIHKIKARDLWVKILITRVETGEPYILYIDTVNRAIPEHHKKLGLQVKTSNLCSEITLHTGIDHLGNNRTAVCCLSSLNLEYFEEWENDDTFILDVMKFLDNVLQNFIDTAPEEMKNAKYSAMRERSIGLGVMGFHSFLQQKMVPIESVMSKVWNKKIFEHIKKATDKVSKKLAEERFPCPDALEADVKERFSNKIAIAPTASISIIAGNASPGIEPYVANVFTQKTLSGSFPVRNKYLEKVLEEKGFNNDQVWSSIANSEGSVQHLTFLSENEKLVFKTAHEIDQRWLIDLSANRTPFICQAQSLNIFIRPDVSKKYLHEIHYLAWKNGLKSMYYLRSSSLQRADKVSISARPEPQVGDRNNSNEQQNKNSNNQEQQSSDSLEKNKYDECLSCQ